METLIIFFIINWISWLAGHRVKRFEMLLTVGMKTD